MALTITRAQAIPSGLVSDRRLYETSDGKPCEEGDAAAAFLLCAGPGDVIPQRTVQRLGLRLQGGRIEWGSKAAEPEAGEPSPPEDGLPEGYELVTMPGRGIYGCQGPDGPLMAGEEPAKVRGKDKAIAQFLEMISAQTDNEG